MIDDLNSSFTGVVGIINGVLGNSRYHFALQVTKEREKTERLRIQEREKTERLRIHALTDVYIKRIEQERAIRNDALISQCVNIAVQPSCPEVIRSKLIDLAQITKMTELSAAHLPTLNQHSFPPAISVLPPSS